jgi:hypothetical protein
MRKNFLKQNFTYIRESLGKLGPPKQKFPPGPRISLIGPGSDYTHRLLLNHKENVCASEMSGTIERLMYHDWSDVYNCDDVDGATKLVKDTITGIFNQCIPLIKLKYPRVPICPP